MCFFVDHTVATGFAVQLLIVHFVGPEGATRPVQYQKFLNYLIENKLKMPNIVQNKQALQSFGGYDAVEPLYELNKTHINMVQAYCKLLTSKIKHSKPKNTAFL